MAVTPPFALPAPAAVSVDWCFMLEFDRTDQGRLAVTLTLKWDVIAVCAVFVFVGAVLLGAF
jgi:hypothetical protein